jgi:hypothetical protein
MSLFGLSWGRCTVPAGFAAPPMRLVNVMPAVERWENHPPATAARFGLQSALQTTGPTETMSGGLSCPRHILIEEEHK